MPPSAKTIAVVTGSRADYGHLVPVMRAIAAEPGLRLQVVATGQHFGEKFGDTWREIAADGFQLDATVNLELGGDTPVEVALATGRGISRTADALARLAPDLMLVLGDRFEILAATTAALLMGIPIAHLHGGELTEGAVDDAIRHAITKMAALHFAAAEPYARRIVQMGEEPARVHVVGAPGLDNLVDVAGLSRAGLAAELKLDLDHDGGGRLFVVTYHPVTQAVDHGRAGAAAMTQALATHPDATVLITGVNSDAGHGAIHAALSAFAAAEPRRRRLTASLGRRLYLGALKHADAVIGNSSSGLVEAPALNTPTVNIGDRQKGRLRAASVIDCAEDAGSISAAIAQALDPTFRAGAAHVAPPYGRGGAATRIAAILADCDPAQLSRKRFHDIIGA